jgi:hypothetical protein
MSSGQDLPPSRCCHCWSRFHPQGAAGLRRAPPPAGEGRCLNNRGASPPLRYQGGPVSWPGRAPSLPHWQISAGTLHARIPGLPEPALQPEHPASGIYQTGAYGHAKPGFGQPRRPEPEAEAEAEAEA